MNTSHHAVSEATESLALAQEEFIRSETSRRIERRRAEHRILEAHPKMPAGGRELLLETDPQVLAADTRHIEAVKAKTRAFGKLEVAKLAAWGEIRR